MSKITLNNIASFQNDSTAVASYTANNATLTTAFDNTLSRDGTSPNQMGSNLDMNSFRILNLPAPASGTDPLRVQDLNSYVTTTANQLTVPASTTSGNIVTWNATNGLTLGTGLAVPLAVASGGTGVTTSTGSGSNVLGTAPTITLPNATGLPLTTGITGTLPVANGGTNYTGGAWTTYTPTVTGTGGTYTFTGSASFLQIGKIVYVNLRITLTVATGAPTVAFASFPVTPRLVIYLLGREDGSGKMCVWRSSDGALIAYDNTTPAGTGTVFDFCGAYEAA